MSAMPQTGQIPDLSVHGLKNLGQVYYNLSKPELYEHAIRRGEGVLSSHGALMCDTGKWSVEQRRVARQDDGAQP